MTELNYNKLLEEVIKEDVEALLEVIKEDTKPFNDEAKRLIDAAFNKEYAELKRLEEQVKWTTR